MRNTPEGIQDEIPLTRTGPATYDSDCRWIPRLQVRSDEEYLATPMEELLRRLLNHLERLGNDHGELYDTECREQMSDAIMSGFVRASGADGLRDDFGLHSAEANLAVREALLEYVDRACAKASEIGLSGFHDRLAAFQNPSVVSEEGSFLDDFFGYAAPEAFDASGNVIGQQ